jgi:hypothetical protein
VEMIRFIFMILTSANNLFFCIFLLFIQMSCSKEDSREQVAANQNSNDSKTEVRSNGNNQNINLYNSGAIPQVNPLPDLELEKYLGCQSDIDCVYVNNGCCDCANSGFYGDDQMRIEKGKEIAVNKNKMADFKARFNCAGVSCTERLGVPACGDGIVTCKNNLCNFSSNR